MLWWRRLDWMAAAAVQLWFCWGWRMDFCPVVDQHSAQTGRLGATWGQRCSRQRAPFYLFLTVAESPARGLGPSQALSHLTWKSEPKAQPQTSSESTCWGCVQSERERVQVTGWVSAKEFQHHWLQFIFIGQSCLLMCVCMCVRVCVCVCVCVCVWNAGVLQINSDLFKHY